MAAPDAVMDAFLSGLALALPGLLTTRDFVPIAQRSIEHLEQGIATLVRLGEKDYANYRGREADLGTVTALLIVQFKLAEGATGHLVENKEIEYAEAIKAFLHAPLPAPLTDCTTDGYKQSAQLETPYGWVIFELEMRA